MGATTNIEDVIIIEVLFFKSNKSTIITATTDIINIQEIVVKFGIAI